jgi:superfamily II DNA helicase RecQ
VEGPLGGDGLASAAILVGDRADLNIHTECGKSSAQYEDDDDDDEDQADKATADEDSRCKQHACVIPNTGSSQTKSPQLTVTFG